jgi:hypothetical protein
MVSSKKAQEDSRNERLQNFIDSLIKISKSKKEAMDNCTKFLSDFLLIPSVYIAVKKTQGDTEILNYVSANPGNEHVIGKKLIKQAEDGDEVSQRQGLSFDVFKLPDEVPEEVDENADPDNPPPPRPPRKPSPLVVDNVMRNPRVKFFGIPKLGAYCAIPLSIESLDHESGLQLEIDEATGETTKKRNKITVPLLIGMDTMGNYRSFTVLILHLLK